MYGYLVKLLKLEVGARHDQDQNKLNLTFLLSYGISNIIHTLQYSMHFSQISETLMLWKVMKLEMGASGHQSSPNVCRTNQIELDISL